MITQKRWQQLIDAAGAEVPLWDLVFAQRQFTWLYLGGPRP
jgi:hypothetical protein